MGIEKLSLNTAMESKTADSTQVQTANTFNTNFLFNSQLLKQNASPSPYVQNPGLFDVKPDLFNAKTMLQYKGNIFGGGIVNTDETKISTQRLQQPVIDQFSTDEKKVQNPQNSAFTLAVNNFITKHLQKRETTLDKDVLKAFPNKEKLELALATNPRISQLLNKVGVYEPEINMANLTDIKESHIMATAEYVRALAEKMGCSEEETNDMIMAAMLHDTGKAFMPRNILAKPGRFTTEERAIIDSHAEIGGEVLKSLGYSPKIVEMVKNHHNPYAFDNGSKVLRACDMASALREKRYYKEPLSIDKTMEILTDSKVESNLLAAIEDVMKESDTQAA